MRLIIRKNEFKNASFALKAQFLMMGVLMPLMGIGFGLLLLYAQFIGHEVPTKNELIEIKGNLINYKFDRQGIRNDFNTIIYIDNYDNGFIVRNLTKDIIHDLFGESQNNSVSFWIDKIRQDKINSGKNILTYGLFVNERIVNQLDRELEKDNNAKDDFYIIGIILICLGLILYRKYLNRIINGQTKPSR
jgi:hypothetical protein